MSAKYMRQVRAAVLEELNRDYVTGARARGVREGVILRGSVLRCAMLTILTLLALSVGSLLGGTAIIESIFQWDGVGKLAVDAITMRDYPMIQAYVVWMAVIYGEPGHGPFIPRAGPADPTGGEPGMRQPSIRRGVRTRLVIFGILALLLILFSAFSAYLTPYDPYLQDLSQAKAPPSAEHLLGTDRYGRDMLSRVIVGSRTSIFSTLLLVAAVTVLGTAVGLCGGFFGGWADAVLMRVSDIFLAFPGLVFALAVAGALGGGLHNAILALAAVSWPKYARLARSQTLARREAPWMRAARLSGSKLCEAFLTRGGTA